MSTHEDAEASNSAEPNSTKFGAFVVLDLETSGIPEHNYNMVSILEICMYGIEASELEKSAEQNDKPVSVYRGDVCKVPPSPRTMNKLSLVVNPRCLIRQEVTQITGLDNYKLENFGNFNENTASMIVNFIKQLPQPVCLVAHNGKFDFPILKATLAKHNMQLPEDVKCVDSLRAFYELDQQIFKELETREIEILQNQSTTTNNDETEGEYHRDLNETTPKRVTKCHDYQLNSKRPRTEASDDCTPQKIPSRPTTPTTSLKSTNFRSRRALFSDAEKNKSTEDMALTRYKEKFIPPKNVYKLGQVYERVYGKITSPLHQAETDVELLMRLLLHYNKDFLSYAQTWAFPYALIKTNVRSTNQTEQWQNHRIKDARNHSLTTILF